MWIRNGGSFISVYFGSSNTLGAELSAILPVIPISVINFKPLNWIMHFMVVTLSTPNALIKSVHPKFR